jgi:hypothetical protein
VVAEGDAELVRRLQKHDPQALGELYDKYGRLAFALIYRIVRDVGTAEASNCRELLRTLAASVAGC